ncbi:hypothetical protein BKA64DRAFT_171972 [Cadophora sp. MPI-SDFR-AT-0126]|nr:hypothetical protein BKA64DRAFT_171972 [Leotiomycetes sp. MPI-SDFR-AT-0126]
MVFLGKPSSDCLPCRKRKLRCDLSRSSCGQCKRAKLLCHGYRDPNELVFRDETLPTKQKALARRGQPSSSSPQILQLSWDVRAREAFFTDYVYGFSRSHDDLAPLFGQASATSHLSASVDAVSVALMSFRTNAPLLRQLAKEKYVAALQKVGQALRKPEFSATNETLQSVLLLDLYEKLVNQDPLSSVAWMSHVEGANSLVKSYGDRFIATQTGRRLATRLAMTLAISCGAARIRIPDALLSLRQILSSFAGDAKWDFTAIVVDVVNLQADIASLQITSSSEIAERAKKLDRQLQSLEATLPPFWAPQSVFISAHPLLFDSSYDVYQDHFVTQVRNAFRTVRLVLNGFIQKHCPPEMCVLKNDAANIILMLTEQICAAITPFVLSGNQQGIEGRFSSLQTLQCYTLIPPLYIAGQMSSSQALRTWAIFVLDYMAEGGRMKIAKDVANILRCTPEVDYWQIYSMVGCYALAA